MTNDPGQPGWAQAPTPDEPDYGQPGYGGQYGEAPQYGQPPQYDPYGQPAPHDAYAQPAAYAQHDPYPQHDPYGQPAPQDPYTQPAPQDPYAHPAPQDPYAQPAAYAQHDPYPQPAPYGQYQQPPYPQSIDSPTQQITPVGHSVDDPYMQYQPPPPQDPYGQPNPYQQPDPYHQPVPPAKKGKGGLIALVGALVLVVCGAGGVAGGYYFTRDSSGDTAADAKPVTANSAAATPPGDEPTESTADTDKLESRTTDPEPVTIGELSAATYTASTGTFTKTGHDREANCGAAVDKAARDLVTNLGCSQAVTVTAVNKDKGCVVTFGILNMPDAKSAEQVVTGMTDGAAGSFVPRRHDAPDEGEAGDPQTGSWWFLMKSYGHYVTFASGAYADGKRVENRDPTMVACDTDMLDEVSKRIGARA